MKMYIVCGYKYCEYIHGPKIKSFGLYNTKQEALNRLKSLMDKNTLQETNCSQSFRSTFGVLWIHYIEKGDFEINLNQPLPLDDSLIQS